MVQQHAAKRVLFHTSFSSKAKSKTQPLSPDTGWGSGSSLVSENDPDRRARGGERRGPASGNKPARLCVA